MSNEVWEIKYYNGIGWPLDAKALHCHEYDEISVILDGKIKYVSENCNNVTSGKAVIYSKAYQLHNPFVSPTHPYIRYQLQLPYYVTKQIIDEFNLSEIDSFIMPLNEDEYDELNTYMRFLHNQYNQQPPDKSKGYLLLSALYMKISELYHNEKPSPPLYNKHVHLYINDVVQYIKKNYSEKIVLQHLADVFFVSRTKLLEDFFNHTGTKIGQYITMEKLKNSKLFLTRGYSVSATAEKCGFSSSSYFINVFQKYNKLTPLQYQRQVSASFIGEK